MTTRKEIKKQQKLKKRAVEKKRKTLGLRAAKRAIVKDEKETSRLEKKVRKLERAMRGIEYYPKEFLETLPEETINKLQHNAEILRSLEDEYDQEMEQKKQVRDNLEEEGHYTPEEKMAAIQQIARAKAEGNDVGLGGAASCKMQVNNPDNSEDKLGS